MSTVKTFSIALINAFRLLTRTQELFPFFLLDMKSVILLMEKDLSGLHFPVDTVWFAI